MKFVYAKVRADHANGWLSLRLEGVQDFPLGFLITEREALELTLERAREILDLGTIRGVFHQERLIGFSGFRAQTLAQTRHRAEIGPFYVSKNFHGTGAADVLMRGIIEEAHDIGIEQLELFVDTENHRAIKFYEKQGFNQIATHTDGVRIDGKSRNDYFYCLRIQH